MRPNDVELTKIGNKEKLRHLVERAQNVFKVCVHNYENDVIKFAEDIDRAVASPQTVTGWDRPWQATEVTKLKIAVQKSQDSKTIAEEAKQMTLQLADSLTAVSNDIFKLADLVDECEDYAEKFLKLEAKLKIEMQTIKSRGELSSADQIAYAELESKAFLVEDSSDALKSLRPETNKHRESLSENIDGIADLLLTDEFPQKKIQIQQEIDTFVGLIDSLHYEVVKSYTGYNKVMKDLADFMKSMDFGCRELISVVQDMLVISREQYAEVSALLDHKSK